MNMNRLSVKLFVAQPAGLDLEAVVPVFHRWIQQSRVPGLLIDVADYRHMVDGPGILLVGHEVDYSLDMGERRPGLRCTRKRCDGEPKAALKAALHGALAAALLLEQEPEFNGKLKLRTDVLQVMLADRLSAPNTAAAFEEWRGRVSEAFSGPYDGTPLRIERDAGDDRRCLTLSVHAPGAPDAAGLLGRLNTA